MIDKHGVLTQSGMVARHLAFFECDKLQLEALLTGADSAGIKAEISDTPPTTTVLLYGNNIDPFELIASGLQQKSHMPRPMMEGPSL